MGRHAQGRRTSNGNGDGDDRCGQRGRPRPTAHGGHGVQGDYGGNGGTSGHSGHGGHGGHGGQWRRRPRPTRQPRRRRRRRRRAWRRRRTLLTRGWVINARSWLPVKLLSGHFEYGMTPRCSLFPSHSRARNGYQLIAWHFTIMQHLGRGGLCLSTERWYSLVRARCLRWCYASELGLIWGPAFCRVALH